MPTSQTETLKPCPFCGSNDLSIEPYNCGVCAHYSVDCNECTATGPEAGNREEAIQEWNERMKE